MTGHDINSQGIPGEIIKPWVERYMDESGHIVETIGVDVINNRVIYRRQGYEHDCVCPRRDWKKKFRKVVL